MKTVFTFSFILISTFVFAQMSRVDNFTDSDKTLFSNINKQTETSDISQLKLTDVRDGKSYKTSQINGKEWMMENLDFQTDGSYSYNDFDGNSKKFGRLYTWEAAQNVCPTGWHLPSNQEWEELIDNFGGLENAATKFMALSNDDVLKSIFGGWRSNNGNYYDVGSKGYYWSSTENLENYAWYRYVQNTQSMLFSGYHKKDMAFSVRCIKN